MLGAVKTEFDKFEDSLKKVQQKIQQSEKEINNLITTRTNVMKKALTNIDRIDDSESSKLLDLD